MKDTKAAIGSSHRRKPVSSSQQNLDSGFRRNDGTKRHYPTCVFLLAPYPLLAVLFSLLFLCGCFSGKRPEARLTSEPSIERGLEMLKETPDGKQITDFLYKNPVQFEYSNTPGFCHKFSLRTGKIFLPRELKEPDALLALTLARAAYIYRLIRLSGLDEVISEEEELGALFQARIGLRINLINSDFTRNKSSGELRSGFCTYIMEGSAATALSARNQALVPQPECQRPLETLKSRRIWLEKILEAINNDSFFQLLHERDLALVRKGVLTMSAAAKNEATVKALPSYEVYRYQRSFYDKQSDAFDRLEKLHREALKDDQVWRGANQAGITAAREEFSACNLPE